MRNQASTISLHDQCHTFRSDIISRQVFEYFADKWTLMVITALGEGTTRFTKLRENVGGISHKMLTMTLRGLESNGLVDRVVYATVPPRVEYSLTHLGRGLLGIADAFCAWCHEHADEIHEAREDYAVRRAAEREAAHVQTSPVSPTGAVIRPVVA